MPTTLPANLVADYQARGFCLVDGLIDAEDCARFRAESLRLAQEEDRLNGAPGSRYRQALRQRVNTWRDSHVMRELTLHPLLCAWASQLAGVPLRLWHDHALIKDPRNGAATEFHQDQPYWPHLDSAQPISAWIALQDVPPERGCMSFIPGSHRHTGLAGSDLTDAGGLFGLCPELAWAERVTLPIRAGSVTFHHGRTAHQAGPNNTDEHRVAHTVIFMPRSTRWDGRRHAVIQPGDFAVGDRIQGELFPEV